MKRLALLCCLLAPLLSVAQQAKEEPIDFEKARGLHQREQAGQPLTSEEQAYLTRAKAAFAKRNGGGSQGPKVAARPSTGMVPLTDLKAIYQGEDGGLYGQGRNDPPEALAKAAAQAASRIGPLDASGKAAKDGRVVLLSIGMSNTTQEFTAFQALSDQKGKRAKSVTLVDGAQGGQTADRIADPAANFWKVIDQRLKQANVTREQVQVVWLKQAFAGPTAPFPTEARKLEGYLQKDIEVLRGLYPNLRLIFLSSRIYAGYASTGLNPEPHAYEGAFAVRWVIQSQLKESGRPAGAPVLLWGPYLWADGEKGRGAGDLVWRVEDFGQDGTHPATSGRQKVAQQLENYLLTSPYAKGWYGGDGK